MDTKRFLLFNFLTFNNLLYFQMSRQVYFFQFTYLFAEIFLEPLQQPGIKANITMLVFYFVFHQNLTAGLESKPFRTLMDSLIDSCQWSVIVKATVKYPFNHEIWQDQFLHLSNKISKYLLIHLKKIIYCN